MEHAAAAPAWAEALEASGFGLFMRQSMFAYPVANLGHLLGLVLLVGSIALLDLRLIGLGRGQVTVEAAARLLTPPALIGFALMAVSGPLMFAADARSLAVSTVVIAKLALVAVGVANALLFRVLWRSRYATWDVDGPAVAKAQAAASIALWMTVAALGRLIAYF
ncbi:DUF6644 family protein [Hansschlegelia sp. KR7-227]|uniref:DUF6644 family protein n=1 Tax=Hansschlegelia sp. KR7-227 TaxID=3400914 RepID=UPI003BFB974D